MALPRPPFKLGKPNFSLPKRAPKEAKPEGEGRKLPKLKVPRLRRSGEAASQGGAFRFTELESRPYEGRPSASPESSIAPVETAVVEETAATAPPAAAPEPAPVVSAPAAAEPAASKVAQEPVEFIEGIGPVFGEKLRAEGVVTVGDLVARDAEHLAQRTGIPGGSLAKWQAMARLMEVRGLGPQYSELLVRSGITSVAELAGLEPAEVARRVTEYQESLETSVEGNAVGEGLAADWVAAARERAPPLPASAAAPAPAVEAPPAAVPANPPRRFALPFARPSAVGASPAKPRFTFTRAKATAPEAPVEGAPAPAAKKRFTFGAKKPAAAPAAPPETAPAEPAPPAATGAAASAAGPKRRGLSFGRRKPAPDGKVEATPPTAPPTAKKRGFAFGRKPAPTAAAGEPAPPAKADPAPVAAPVATETSAPAPEPAVVAQVAAPAPVAQPAVPPAPTLVLELPPAMPRPAAANIDFDHLHLRVDRVLGRGAVQAPVVVDRRDLNDKVDDVLAAKRGRGRGAAGHRRTPR